MTIVHTLASGSSGNALLLSCGDTHLLVDAGISCRRITASLQELGLTLKQLAAILITHTHSDHICGLKTLLKRTAVPVFGTERTCRELARRMTEAAPRLRALFPDEKVLLGGCCVTMFPVSHDEPGTCGYRFDTEDGSIGLMTDTGYVTEAAAEVLTGIDLAILEANHDVETLCSGAYPYYLKQRILGDAGHLCNEAAARFAVSLAESGTSQIVLAHLSRENNTPAMARNAVACALSAAELAPDLMVAPRDCLSEAYCVVRRGICRK